MDGPEEMIEQARERFRSLWEQGPTRTRWTSLPPQVGDPAPDAELLDQTGATRRLSELWEDGPVLIVFWRHFGCGCGIDRAARLRDEHDEIVEAGGRVALVGQGEPERAAAYRKRHDLPGIPILCDLDREVYEAYGLRQGVPEQLLYDAPEAFYDRTSEPVEDWIEERAGTERTLVDDPWQLPGEFVVDGEGTIRLDYRYNYCEDFPDPRLLVAAVRHAAPD